MRAGLVRLCISAAIVDAGGGPRGRAHHFTYGSITPIFAMPCRSWAPCWPRQHRAGPYRPAPAAAPGCWSSPPGRSAAPASGSCTSWRWSASACRHPAALRRPDHDRQLRHRRRHGRHRPVHRRLPGGPTAMEGPHRRPDHRRRRGRHALHRHGGDAHQRQPRTTRACSSPPARSPSSPRPSRCGSPSSCAAPGRARSAAALVMGVAVCGMHYTGMADVGPPEPDPGAVAGATAERCSCRSCSRHLRRDRAGLLVAGSPRPSRTGVTAAYFASRTPRHAGPRRSGQPARASTSRRPGAGQVPPLGQREQPVRVAGTAGSARVDAGQRHVARHPTTFGARPDSPGRRAVWRARRGRSRRGRIVQRGQRSRRCRRTGRSAGPPSSRRRPAPRAGRRSGRRAAPRSRRTRAAGTP